MRRVRAVARGEVQGVGYRYTMQQVAQRARATGWVRNLRDGSVEAEVEGTDAQIESVLAWMAEGPRGGRVSSVDRSEIDPVGGTTFEVRRDG